MLSSSFFAKGWPQYELDGIVTRTAASFLLAAGTHTKVVQEHLGHSSYAITADIYSHVAPPQQREAADRLDAGAPLVTLRSGRVAVRVAVLMQRRAARSGDPPLTCAFTVGLTGFEPATP